MLREIDSSSRINGCLLFRPLPPRLNTPAVLTALRPEKDIDAMTGASMGGLMVQGLACFPPCTVSACVELLRFYQIPLAGKNVVIVGTGATVGMPAAVLLMSLGATVSACNILTEPRLLLELCQRAEIHKSTFYDHYADVYALSDALETQVVESVLQGLTHPEYLFEQPELFTRELFAAYRSQGALIHLLFSGSRSGNLVAKIERAVKELAFARYPACREDPVVNIALSYAIYGGYYAYEENLRYGGEQVAEVVAQASRDIHRMLQGKLQQKPGG